MSAALLANYQRAQANLVTISKGYQFALPDDLTEQDRDALDHLWWMSWQPIGQFPARLKNSFDHLAGLGLAELHQPDGAREVTRVRLAVARWPQPAIDQVVLPAELPPLFLSDTARAIELARAGGDHATAQRLSRTLAAAAARLAQDHLGREEGDPS